LLFGVGCLIIGYGLDTTLTPTISAGAWAGFQVLCGLEFALLVQMPIVAIQRELKSSEIPMCTTVVVFGQVFSTGLFVAVAQPVFESVLRSSLVQLVPSLDVQKVIEAGAGGLHTMAASPGELQLLREAYSHACTRVFVSTTRSMTVMTDVYVFAVRDGWSRTSLLCVRLG
jgi:hypothetical protein